MLTTFAILVMFTTILYFLYRISLRYARKSLPNKMMVVDMFSLPPAQSQKAKLVSRR